MEGMLFLDSEQLTCASGVAVIVKLVEILFDFHKLFCEIDHIIDAYTKIV